MDELTNLQIIQWLTELSKNYTEKEAYLTDLDRQIGDADHGFNMARGFSAVATKLATMQDSDIGILLKTTAMTLISTVGGASGPLYGSFFLKASMTANGKMTLNKTEVGQLLDAGFQSVLARGKANLGDKTMVDAMQPAIEAYHAQEGDGLKAALEAALQAAQKGAESTIPLVAKKGRASYLGDRSAGHLDPGAASTVMLFETLFKVATV